MAKVSQILGSQFNFYQHLERPKMTVYLIRHAQSAFNAVHDPNKPDPMIFDAPITALGETQAQQARSEIKQLDLINVIVSPFTRTLQTAQLIFQKSGLKPPTSIGKDPTVRRRRSKPLNPSTLVGGGSVENPLV